MREKSIKSFCSPVVWTAPVVLSRCVKKEPAHSWCHTTQGRKAFRQTWLGRSVSLRPSSGAFSGTRLLAGDTRISIDHSYFLLSLLRRPRHGTCAAFFNSRTECWPPRFPLPPLL